MLLTEKIKNFIKSNDKGKNPSSIVNPVKTINNLTDDNYLKQNDFFDYQEDTGTSVLDNYSIEVIVKQQAEKIQGYRKIAMYPDVSEAIDIIVNEIIFTYEDKPVKLDVKIDNDEISKNLEKCFNEVYELLNLDKNLYSLVRQCYIDGQLFLHCEYDEKKLKKGIQKIRIIDPIGLYYNNKENIYEYMDTREYSIYFTNSMNREKYSPEEIVRTDFGLYMDFICLSYLEQSMKYANMLKSLEDLLIPLRFSRSISRRVFNIDVGNLPGKRAEEYMKQVQNKFKYKKFYNNDTGEISNQQHITSMVEDYWFCNRSGSKGTSVETLDETGNLGELDDIIYLAKKLYRALKIPSSHLDIDPNSDHSFSSDPTETTQEDIRFMNFVSRLRIVYTDLFKKLLKLQVVSKKIMSERDFDKISKYVNVVFSNENLFIEKLKLSIISSKLEVWNELKDLGGTVFSFKDIQKRVFGLSDVEIEEHQKAIKDEMKSGKFDIFYKLADIELSAETGMMGMTDAEGNPMDADEMSMHVYTDDDDDDDDDDDNDDENSDTSDTSKYSDEMIKQNDKEKSDSAEKNKETKNTKDTKDSEVQKKVSDFFTNFTVI